MCLMLYIGTSEDLPTGSSKDLKVEIVEPARQGVTQWFSQPVVRFLGAHTGCSCGLRSVISESPIEHYEDMSLGRAAARSSRVELYPVAAGDEATPPKGVIEWRLSSLDPDRFFFNERFMHVVHDQP